MICCIHLRRKGKGALSTTEEGSITIWSNDPILPSKILEWHIQGPFLTTSCFLVIFAHWVQEWIPVIIFVKWLLIPCGGRRGWRRRGRWRRLFLTHVSRLSFSSFPFLYMSMISLSFCCLRNCIDVLEESNHEGLKLGWSFHSNQSNISRIQVIIWKEEDKQGEKVLHKVQEKVQRNEKNPGNEKTSLEESERGRESKELRGRKWKFSPWRNWEQEDHQERRHLQLLCNILPLPHRLFPWCSGYHVCFTRTRSPVRTRPETWNRIAFSQFFFSISSHLFYTFFFYSERIKNSKIFSS